MVSYQDVPECDQSVLINEKGLEASGRAKPRPWRLGMGLTLVGAVCFMSYWSGFSLRGGAKLTIRQGRGSNLNRALLSLAEILPRHLADDVEVTQHLSIQLGPKDAEGEPEAMTVKLTLKPKTDADDAEAPVVRWAFKYKDGTGDDMKKVLEDEIASHKEDMEEEMGQSDAPEVTIDEEKGLVYVDEKLEATPDQVKEIKEVNLNEATIVFEMATGRDLTEMIEHEDESTMVVHGGIKAKVEVTTMESIEMKMEELVAAEAEKDGDWIWIGEILKCIRAFGLDATFKYSEPALSEVALSMGVPSFAQVLGILRSSVDEETIGFFSKLKDSADGLDHVSLTGVPESPDFVLEFTNFRLTDFLLKLADTKADEEEESETQAEESE